jgi:tRNA dimethylallyltransferase
MNKVTYKGMRNNLGPLIAIIGPTASGKTALASSLAVTLGGELISADSRQVYRGMDIGTAKERNLPVPQHLIDIKDPEERMTVAEFQALAYKEINNIHAAGKIPFLVGGSGLYAEAVMSGYLFEESGKSTASHPRYTSLKIGIAIEREELRKRVAARTSQWIEQGLLEEIKGLIQQGVSRDWIVSLGMEYRYFTLYLEGALSLEEAITKTNISINQFIKRQYTWWRRHANVHWVEGETEAEALVKAFLQSF